MNGEPDKYLDIAQTINDVAENQATISESDNEFNRDDLSSAAKNIYDEEFKKTEDSSNR